MSENKRPAEMPMIRPGGRRGPGPGMQPVKKADTLFFGREKDGCTAFIRGRNYGNLFRVCS